MKLFNRILVISFLFFCFKTFAQQSKSYHVKHYSILDGLSNNWISDIYQDKDGFIWFGTQYGINRFDGQDFNTYTYIPGDTTALSGNWVRSIIQLNDEKIYLGTLGGGVNIMDPYKEEFKKLIPDSDSERKDILIINNLIKDLKNYLWISSIDGVYRYDPANSHLKKIYDKRSTNIINPSGISTFILGKEGVYEVFEDNLQLLKEIKNEDIKNLYSISKDSLLIYTQTDLFLYRKNKNQWQSEKLNSEKLNFETAYTNSVSDRPFIFKDHEDWIWVNGGDNLYKLSKDLTQQHVYPLKNLLGLHSKDKPIANCMFQDVEGSYWLGTNMGVFQLVEKKPLSHPILGPLGKAREIVSCGNKTWFAMPEGIKVWNHTNSPPRIVSSNTVTSMICASDNYIYALDKGIENTFVLLKINPIDETVEAIHIPTLEMSTSVAWKIVEDQNQRLWIAQWDGILIYDLKDKSFTPLKLFEGNFGIIELFADNYDNVWVGTLGEGLLKFSNASKVESSDNPEFQQFLHEKNNPNSLSSDLILSIHQTKDGKLWVGTDGGLNNINLEKNEFQRYIRNEQLINDKILNITSDKKGILWMSSISHGIISYDPNIEKFTNFTTNDGLYDNSMLLSSIFQDNEGFIWMGSEKGIQYFHPNQLTTSKSHQPQLLWTSYTKYRSNTTLVQNFPNKNRELDSSLYIHPEDQNISFRFTTTSFKKSENIRYRFWVKGFHSNWLPDQENGVLTLSNIPKGTYTLHVEARDIDNLWKVSYKPVSIVVIPPWYLSNIAYLAYLSVVFLLFFIFYKMQLRKKIAETEKEFIQDLAISKTKWFNQIAHEFRTPLTVILGATDQLRSKLTSSELKKTKKHVFQIEDQADHLSKQVQQILEIAQIKDNQLSIEETQGDFIAFHRYLYFSFNSLAKEKQIELFFSSTHTKLQIPFDEDKWRKITSNLLSNAIKYNNPGGTILLNIKYDDEKNMIQLQVKDSGVGINSDFISTLFDPFTKEKVDNTNGVGLGLTLTKELITLLGGNIKVESQKNKGTTFTINVPVSESIQKDIITENSFEILEDDSLPLILIAEDHKEVREYIEFSLSNKYKLLTAQDGMEAWTLCEKHLPDLIISDIMMPKLDGIQLGTKVREHMATNHIPFILLTAKTSDQDQIQGLKIGADAYLAKPFNREELLIRVNNLILTRKKLQEKYQQGVLSISSENSTIDHFMKNVIEIIKKHLDNDEFSVPELANELNISRVHLYRKIKNLTGMPPTKIIRKIRLQVAKDLLIRSDYTISEIAYKIGFKDPSYFTRVYIEEFGITPTQFRN